MQADLGQGFAENYRAVVTVAVSLILMFIGLICRQWSELDTRLNRLIVPRTFLKDRFQNDFDSDKFKSYKHSVKMAGGVALLMGVLLMVAGIFFSR
jgi:hypothetical protein